MSRSSVNSAQGLSRARAKSPRRVIDKPVRRETQAAWASLRQVVSFNDAWLFRRADRDGQLDSVESTNGQPWATVQLPHSVRLDPLNASGGRNYQGICWYRKKFRAAAAWRGRSVWLRFEGAMQAAEVWLDGRKIAAHQCGYTPFVVDLTKLLGGAEAEHVLSVRLDNSDNANFPPGKPQRELDFSYFGGLYRNVWVSVADPLHITDPILEDRVAGGGVFVTYPQVSARTASVRVRTEVRNEYRQVKKCRLRQELLDAGGAIVATASETQVIPADGCATFDQMLEVAKPLLWHPDHPNLYSLRTTACDQAGAVDDVTTRIGIRHIQFDRENGLLINGEKFFSIGANRHQDHPYVGCALPDSGQRRDARKLFEAGFTSFRSHYPQAPAFMDACDELGMLAIVSNPGWQFVGGREFQQQAVANARRMIRRDRNRPCVILWEAALNESNNLELCAALQAAAHEEYPGDQCFTAGDREKSGMWDVEYLHNDGEKPYWIREWGDHVDNWSDQQSRSRVPRGWGETPMLTQMAAHLARMNEIMEAGKRLSGACLWAGIDCQRGYHHQPFQGGVMDLFRLPKFDYYLFQSQRPTRAGPMVFIANFATFFSPTAVTIFSNCEEVRLRVDGREVGRNKPDRGHAIAHPPFTFQVESFAPEQSTMYMNCGATVEKPPMELKAEGLIGGKVVAVHVVRPPGVAARVEMEADLCGEHLIAGGGDWVRVYARVCDARGTVCPLADDWITFAVEGDGRIIGGAEIGANPLRAEAGIATALVQSGRKPGTMTVTAGAFGLAGGKVSITSMASDGRRP